MMGSWWWWQILARALTSSTDRGNTTTSGGRHLTWQDKNKQKTGICKYQVICKSILNVI